MYMNITHNTFAHTNINFHYIRCVNKLLSIASLECNYNARGIFSLTLKCVERR